MTITKSKQEKLWTQNKGMAVRKVERAEGYELVDLGSNSSSNPGPTSNYFSFQNVYPAL